MSKVKNIIKKNYKIMIGFMLGGIIFGTFVYAETVFKSSDIAYDNSSSGLTSTNLQGAIDELYEKANNRIKYDSSEIQIGDRVIIGTEKFYVISYDNEYVELLAKYNLKVGKNWEDYNDNFGVGVVGNNVGIQDKNCTGLPGTQTYYDNYQYQLVEREFAGFTCTDGDGYSNSTYITNYANYLKNNFGVDVKTIRYLDSNDLLSLGCTEGTDKKGNKMAVDCSNTGYNWLYTSQYFLGNELYYSDGSSSSEKISMFSDGQVAWKLSVSGNGYRPVIKINRNVIS